MYTIFDDIKRYKPVLSLVRIISRPTLNKLRTAFFAATALGASGCTLIYLFTPEHSLYPVLVGLTLIFGALWVEQVLLYSYINSFYYHGLNSIIGLNKKKISGITYEVAEALSVNKEDVVFSFCTSNIGTAILLRAGVDPKMLDVFLQKAERPRISTLMIPLNPEEIFTFISLGEYIYQQDSAFATMLKEQGISEDIFFGSLKWVVGSYLQNKREQRWWGKDNLSRSQGIGKEWAYGTAYILQKYSRDIKTSSVFSTLTQSNSAFTEEKIAEIEVALARAKSANVLIIGEAGVGKIDLVMEVNRRMQVGQSLSSVQGQHMILLDTNHIFATHRSKQELELTLLSLFSEAMAAGNIIIVIENLSTFIREAEAMGVFIPELLDSFLATQNLHLIATDTPGAFHSYIEPLGGFSRRFEEVLIDTPNLNSTTEVLQGIALEQEKRYQLLFTFSSLTTITSSADRYIVDGVMPDKAISLLVDVATRAHQSGTGIVTSDFVYQTVSEKTGIPAGPVGEEERDLLLNLEEHLHKRVVGQQSAIDAIAKTMRRSRAGIQATDKPIGSFLFLGPTGVGKTETAKALAYVFFGDEKNMLRLDMSEFSGDGALSHLIGSNEKAGVLSSILQEHPYSVLLLDEFEKASVAVHDIFLQILDEGVFTDGRGSKVNARNSIIIATSNAGSQLILKTVNQRKELATLSQEIISHIINEGIYRPELINRFDSTIIFEPLTLEEQGQVANLLLKGLYERIKERGYELTLTRDLIDILVEKGYDPQFGARPMVRVLQDVIEEKVAERIISGEAKVGETITLTKKDFSEVELSI